eukprot:COSAG06_NODE_1359_length_9719_cov_14.493971_2_plen_284_part_00
MDSERNFAGKRSVEQAFDAYEQQRRQRLGELGGRVRESRKRSRASRTQLDRVEAARDTMLSDDSDDGVDTALASNYQDLASEHATRQARVRANERAYLQQRASLNDVYAARRQYDRLAPESRHSLEQEVDGTVQNQPHGGVITTVTDAIDRVRGHDQMTKSDLTNAADNARGDAGNHAAELRFSQREYNIMDERALQQLSDSDDDAPHIELARFKRDALEPQRQTAVQAERHAQHVEAIAKNVKEGLTKRAKSLNDFQRALDNMRPQQGTGLQRVLSSRRVVP